MDPGESDIDPSNVANQESPHASIVPLLSPAGVGEVATRSLNSVDRMLFQSDMSLSELTTLAMPNTFEQIPLSTVVNRVDAGSECLLELIQSFKAVADMEEKTIQLSTKISRQSIYEHEINATTTEKALGFLKNYFIYLTQEHVKFHKTISEDILKSLESVKARRTTEINKFKLLVQQAFRETQLAVEQLEKAKKYCLKAKNDVYSTQQKLAQLEIDVIEFRRMQEEKRKEKEAHAANASKFSVGRILSSAFEASGPETERDKQKRKLAKRFKLLVDCTATIAAKKRVLAKKIEDRDNVIAMAALAFEAAELERLAQTQTALKQFTDIEREMNDKRTKLLAKFSSAVDIMDSKQDMKLFIRREKNNDITHKHSRALSLLDWDFHRKMQSMKAEHNGNPNLSSFSMQVHNVVQQANIKQLADLNKLDWGEVRSLSMETNSNVTAYIFNTIGDMSLADISNMADDDDLAPAPLGNAYTPSSSSSATATISSLLTSPLKRKSTSVNTEQSSASSITSTTSTSSSVASTRGIIVGTATTAAGVAGMSTGVVVGVVEPPADGTSSEHQPGQSVEYNPNADSESDYLILSPDSDAITPSQPPQPLSTQQQSTNGNSTTDQLSLESVTEEYRSAEAEIARLTKLINIIFADKTVLEAIGDAVSSTVDAIASATVDLAKDTFNTIISGTPTSHLPHSDNSYISPDYSSDNVHSKVTWTEVFSSKMSRDLFLQDLDVKRGTHSLLDSDSLAALSTAMTSLLNQCQIEQDIKSAMRVANMANTFHRYISLTDNTRVYLQQDPNLRNHPIWKEEGFWDSALFIGIAAELEHRDPVLWDELSSDLLREQILAIQNIVFGQLGTMAVTMHEIGLSHVEVAKRLTKMSRSAQLNEDQILDLLKTVRSTYRLAEQPNGTRSASEVLTTSVQQILTKSPAAELTSLAIHTIGDALHATAIAATSSPTIASAASAPHSAASPVTAVNKTKTIVAQPSQITDDNHDEFAVL